MLLTGRFAKYDHGLVDNKEEYQSAIAPPYNLPQITCPVDLYYGQMDNLAAPQVLVNVI